MTDSPNTKIEDIRYVYKEESISEERAKELRENEIEAIECKIECILDELREEKNWLAKRKTAPLDKFIRVQYELRPGDDGYEEAPIGFNPLRYQGNVTWHNL